MRRWLVGLAALLIVTVVVVEVAALPVATRVARQALERCVSFDDLQVERIDRPVLPGLLLGRARGVELEATGLRFDGIRAARARMELPEVGLPWAIRPPPPTQATVELELSDRDVQDFLAERTPFGLEPVVELTPGIAALGIESLPVRVQLEVEVRDGLLRFTPVGAIPDWFDALGLDLSFELADELPDDARLDRVEIRRDALLATLRVEVGPGIDGSSGCAGALGDDEPREREATHG